jgi:predicted nucleotidyltransferase
VNLAADLPLDRIGAICRKYGVSELAVFGSALRDDFGPDSDVDFLYVLSPDSTLGWEIVDLRDELRAAVGRDVDIVRRSSTTASPSSGRVPGTGRRPLNGPPRVGAWSGSRRRRSLPGRTGR